MKNKYKIKEETNPEIIREKEEKEKTDALYSPEKNRKLIFLYALLLSNGVYSGSGYGAGIGAVLPPILFWELLD